jgi:hypothetical protein
MIIYIFFCSVRLGIGELRSAALKKSLLIKVKNKKEFCPSAAIQQAPNEIARLILYFFFLTLQRRQWCVEEQSASVCVHEYKMLFFRSKYLLL